MNSVEESNLIGEAVFLTCQGYDGAAFWRLVREAGEHGCLGQVALLHAVQWHKARSLAVAQRDGAGLI